MKKLIFTLFIIFLANNLFPRAGRGTSYRSGAFSSSGSSSSSYFKKPNGSSSINLWGLRKYRYNQKLQKELEKHQFDEKKHEEWKRQLELTNNYTGYFRTRKYKAVFQLKKSEIQVTESFNHIYFSKNKKGIYYQPQSPWKNYYINNKDILGGINDYDITNFNGFHIKLFSKNPQNNFLRLNYKINNEISTQFFPLALKEKIGNFSFKLAAKAGIDQYIIEFLPIDDNSIDYVKYCILNEIVTEEIIGVCKNKKPRSPSDGVNILGKNLKKGQYLIINLFLKSTNQIFKSQNKLSHENLDGLDYYIHLNEDGTSNRRINTIIISQDSKEIEYSILLPNSVSLNSNITGGASEKNYSFIDYSSNNSIQSKPESQLIGTIISPKKGHKQCIAQFSTFGDLQIHKRDSLKTIFSQYNFFDSGVENSVLSKTSPSNKIAIFYIPLPEITPLENFYISNFTKYNSIKIKFPDFIDTKTVLYHLTSEKDPYFFPLHTYRWDKKTLNIQFYENLEETRSGSKHNPFWLVIYMPGDRFDLTKKSLGYQIKEFFYYAIDFDWDSVATIITILFIGILIFIGYKNKWGDKLANLISKW